MENFEMKTLKSIIYYFLLPVFLPFVLIQECLDWFWDKLNWKKYNFEGKVVLITGASAGIGRSLAHSFYKRRCRVILASRRRAELEKVKTDLLFLSEAKSVKNDYVPEILEMDIGDLQSIPEKAQAAHSLYGEIDILVNNAGIAYQGTVMDTDIEVHEKIMTVNYFGAVALTKEIVRHMKERKSGNVIFMSSVQGKIGIPFQSAYGASKHALEGLADSLRSEVAAHGVQVTTISPGYVQTNISLNALTAKGLKLNKMDENLVNGYSPDFIAERTIEAIQNGDKEVLISTLLPKLFINLRQLIPDLYFQRMSVRASKIKQQSVDRG